MSASLGDEAYHNPKWGGRCGRVGIGIARGKDKTRAGNRQTGKQVAHAKRMTKWIRDDDVLGGTIVPDDYDCSTPSG